MNCKPGDLAFVIVPGAWYGCLVSVIEVAPIAVFTLPDGQKHQPAEPQSWVIETLGRPFSAPVQMKAGVVHRVARFGVARDNQLRPMRPGDLSDEEVRDLYLPQRDGVTS